MRKITFAERLKEARIVAKLSQEALAKKLGRSKSTISRWESGERNPKMFEMVELENALGVPAETLIYGTEKIQPSILSEITKILKQLDDSRQRIVLDTAISQFETQKNGKEIKKVTSSATNSSHLMEKDIQEILNNTPSYNGIPLSEREKEIVKYFLKKTVN